MTSWRRHLMRQAFDSTNCLCGASEVVEKGTGRPPPVSAVTIRTWLGDLMVRAAAAASPEGPRPWQVPVESEFSVLATEMML
jgi:hypothetical protein